MAEEIDLETCSYGQLSEVQMVRDLDLDLGSGQGHVNIHSTCRTTCILNHVTVASRTTSLNSRDTFRGRKFENRTLISCRPRTIVSPSTISFDVHVKMAEEIDLEMCSYGQLLDQVKVIPSYTVRAVLLARQSA